MLPTAIASVIDDFTDENFQPTEQHIQHLVWSDGLLMAVAIGPVRTEPQEWLAAMHGGGAFTDEPELAEAIHGMNLMRIDQIMELLEERGPKFKAILDVRCDEATLVVRAEHWASGFLCGMRLRYAAWRPMLSDPVGRRAFAPLLPFLKTKDGAPLLQAIRPDEVLLAQNELLQSKLEVLPLLGEAVFKMHLFWQEHREDARRHGGRLGKVGRNEPCPCGSGQKYKRCCLN